MTHSTIDTMTISDQRQCTGWASVWLPCTDPPAEPMWCEGRWPGHAYGFPVYWDGTKWCSKIFGARGDFWRERVIRAA